MGITFAAGEIPSAGKLTVQQAEGVATGTLALTSTQQDVGGATVTLSAQTNSAFYIATITARMERTTNASAAFGIVRLDLDGTNVAGTLPIAHNVTVAETWTISKTWTGTVTAGSHTWKMRASCATSSIWQVTSSDSNLVVVLFG